MKTLMIASDHGGWDLKEKIKHQFPEIQWVDLGPQTDSQSVDYPDYADLVCLNTKPEIHVPQGILICGSGQGMAIRAIRYPHIRAALVWSEECARLSREHNDANVLCLGGRLIPAEVAYKCVQIFLETPFAGGRHAARLKKLSKPINPK